MKKLVTPPHKRRPRIDVDSNLSNSSKCRLRNEGVNAVNKRPRGRPPRTCVPQTRAGIWKKQRRERLRREALRTIVIGAGTGRVGSMCLAANLQRQGFDVSHEAGNPASIDKRSRFRDYFRTSHMSTEKKDRIASDMLKVLRLNPLCTKVVGDISWSNTTIAESLLNADDRVQVIFQTRPHLDFAKSHMQHHPTGSRWETILLNDWGISARNVPARQDRLMTWSGRVLGHAKEVKDLYPDRVHIVPLKDLNSFGKKFVKALGGATPWDSACGANASGMSRNELRSKHKHGQKRKQTTTPAHKMACARNACARNACAKERPAQGTPAQGKPFIGVTNSLACARNACARSGRFRS